MAERQTLGPTLRAARLGFHWSDMLRCYVRVSGDTGRWLVELARAGHLPTHPQSGHGMHRCWWEGETIEPLLYETITRPAGNGARALPKLDGLLSLTVDDLGRVLEVHR